jgi:hypothetical protein
MSCYVRVESHTYRFSVLSKYLHMVVIGDTQGFSSGLEVALHERSEFALVVMLPLRSCIYEQ